VSALILTGTVVPSTPPAGKGKLFMQTDKKWYVIDDTGTVYEFGDAIHTHVEGDIIDLDKYTQTEVHNLTLDAGYF
jgi:hypothetical protein